MEETPEGATLELNERGEETLGRQEDRVKGGKGPMHQERAVETAMEEEGETPERAVPQQKQQEQVKGTSKKDPERGRPEKRSTKLTEMEPGEKRDVSVVSGLKGMKRGMSMSPSPAQKRQASPSPSPRSHNSTKNPRRTGDSDTVNKDKNRNSLPANGGSGRSNGR